MVEHLTFNQVVPGSSPGCLIIKYPINKGKQHFDKNVKVLFFCVLTGDRARTVTGDGSLSPFGGGIGDREPSPVT